MEDNPETISVFANADIAVLRSGKAKKNDPPIPEDLAPISGAGKRVRREENSDEKLFLDPIKFRYSTETIVEEEVKTQEESAQENRENRPRRSRQHKKHPGEKPAQPEKTPEAPKSEKEKKEGREKEPKAAPDAAEHSETPDDAGQAKKSGRRRPNYRRHRKPKANSDN